MYKKGITLVPWEKEIFWAGSSYEWSFQDDSPTKAFHDRCNSVLKEWLNVPFEIVDHQAAIRPATLERRPFAGFHPIHPPIGILNGMGTKGCSLAPFFAHALTEQIRKGAAIHPEADILRFKQLLSANNP
jgi:glycine/D-amino acid oxidase-like deaminating enzyme